MTMTQRRCARAAMPALIGTGALLAALIPSHFTASTPVHAASTHSCVVFTGSGDTTFTRNFNTFASPLDYTNGGIYEPLYIITTAGGGHVYPWLATNYAFKDGNKTLLITVRQGVKWSDGQPFTAKDVLFTYTAGRINPAMDQVGLVSADSNIASINLVGSTQVAVHFKKVDTTVLPTFLSYIKIVPQHIWSKVKNVTTFTNPNPVGTGPYTQVQRFSGQDYVLGKNPYYWQAAKPAVPCVERTFASNNDSAALSMAHGDVDWTHNFVPNVQKVYVAKDPAHFHYFYATNNTPNALNFNDTVYPYSIVNFRKAVSMALNRPFISQIAEYGYEPPTDATGIAQEWPTWVDRSLDAQSKALTTYNPSAAKALLASSGFTLKGGQLYDPKGHKVSVPLNVVSGFSDFVLATQLIERELKALGIDSSVTLSANYNSWANVADKGLVPHLHWSYGGTQPYNYYYSFMSKHSYVPTGKDAVATGNWARFYSPAADALFAQYRQTTDAGTQHTITNKLEKIAIDQMPIIPVMTAANWYTYSTLYFTGWPTPQNFYANGWPGTYPDTALVLTKLTPVK